MYKIFAILSVFYTAFLGNATAIAADQPLWKKACVDDAKPATCRISKQLFLNKKVDGKMKQVGRVLGLTILYLTDAKKNTRSPYMSIQMPLGIDLRPGAVMKIDNNKEITLQYLQCTAKGCDASVALDASLLRAMKAGNGVKIGFRGWGVKKVTAVNVSLKGFTRAFAQLR